MTGLRPWTLAAYLAAIFTAGAVSGWFAGSRAARSAVRTPPPMEEFSRYYRERLISKLTLTEDQKKEIDAILKRTSAEMNASHQQNLARILAARSNRTAQVVAILTPEQRAQYAELEKTYEQERRSWGTNAPWRGRPPGFERGEHSHGDAPWGRRDRDWPRPGTNPPNPSAGDRTAPPPTAPEPPR
jgi:Spy/CpxP family protein refolding chaperone